jgi:hypothetical protein
MPFQLSWQHPLNPGLLAQNLAQHGKRCWNRLLPAMPSPPSTRCWPRALGPYRAERPSRRPTCSRAAAAPGDGCGRGRLPTLVSAGPNNVVLPPTAIWTHETNTLGTVSAAAGAILSAASLGSRMGCLDTRSVHSGTRYECSCRVWAQVEAPRRRAEPTHAPRHC